MPDETETLRAEVAELRAEVTELRAWRDSHACAPAAPVTQSCTCGTPGRCPVHAPSWPGTLWYTQPVAGAAGGAYTYTIPWNNTAGSTVTVGPLHYNTAGAAPMPQIMTFNVGGECS